MRKRVLVRPPALLLAATLMMAGCASTDDSLPPAYVPAPASTSGARALAAELGLRPRADPALGAFALEGEHARILFVLGTRTATVAGERVECGEDLRLDGDDVPLTPADAVRISGAWGRATGRLRARHAAASRAVEAPPRSEDTPGPEGVPDPAWRVPLKRQWKGILIHHSATAAGNLAKFDYHHKHVNGWLMVGYDFIICNGNGGSDGLVETTDRWRQQIQGAHAGTGLKEYNDHWVGICLVGDFNDARPTVKQLQSLARLVRFLQSYCRIPAANVRGHRDVRGATDCPGRQFPLGDFQGGARAW